MTSNQCAEPNQLIALPASAGAGGSLVSENKETSRLLSGRATPPLEGGQLAVYAYVERC
jgi:hypothetical protein